MNNRGPYAPKHYKKTIWNPIQISSNDYKHINFDKLSIEINDISTCIHKENKVTYFTIDYRLGGISIEFSLEECIGQGIAYLTLEGAVKEIEYIVNCDKPLPEPEISESSSDIEVIK